MHTVRRFRTTNPPQTWYRYSAFPLLASFLFLSGTAVTARASTTITSKTISGSETWTAAGSPYLVSGTVTINKGASLSIDPGVIVKVNSGGFSVYGSFIASGTSENHIRITDYRDDSVGGDTNGDGATPVPPFANWGSITVLDQGAATLDYCDINYGGGSYGTIYKLGSGVLSVTNSSVLNSHYWSEGICIDGSANQITGPVTISNNVINNGGANNAYDGIYLKNAGSSITISDNTIQNCRWHGINLKNSSPTLGGNTINGSGEYGLYVSGTSNPNITGGNLFSGNAYGFMAFDAQTLPYAHLYDSLFPGQPVIMDYIGGQGTTTISVNSVLQSERPYLFKSGLNVNSGITLTIQSATGKDVVTKWAGSALSVAGNLHVAGSTGHRVYFTDARDDSVAGDTNGDGTATTPSGWPGIWVTNGGSAALDYSDIRYGGSSNGAVYKAGTGNLSLTNSSISNSSYWGEGVYLDGATNQVTGPITISNTVIDNGGSNFAYDGIYLNNTTSNVTISGNTVRNCRNNGIVIKNASPQLSGNTITANTNYGVYAFGASVPGISPDNDFSGNGYGSMGFDVPAVANAHLYDSALPGQTIYVDTMGGAGSSTVATTTAWRSERPYYFRTGVSVNSGATLTIQSVTGKDVVTKWAAGALITVNGNLVAQGSGGKKVYFTDYRDDSIGGDTNGNGSTNAPAAGWWSGISVSNNGTALLDSCEIRYAGWNNNAIYKTGSGGLSLTNSIVDHTSYNGIHLDATSAAHTISGNTIRNSSANGVGIYLNNAGVGTLISDNTIHSNTSYGIFLTGAGSTPNIFKNTIHSNPVGIHATSSANPLIGGSAANGNLLINNSIFSVQNTTSSFSLNAQYNDWGSVSGPQAPTNPSGNPSSKVSSYVDFANYISPHLNVSIAGYGTVQGSSAKSQNFSCTSSACSAPFAHGDVATLDATPATDFVFAGWTGDCAVTGALCTVTLDANKYVTATFTTSKTALLITTGAPTAYSSLATAFGAVPDSSTATIQSQATDFSGDFTIDRNVTLVLKGGLDASFTTVTGLSNIIGNVTVADGVLTVENLAAQ